MLVSSRRRRATMLAAVAAIATLAIPTRARACCPATTAVGTSRVETLDAERRLAWIDGELERSAHRGHLWLWSWEILLGVGTVGNLVPVPFVKADERIDWYTGAVTTGVGIVPLLVDPPKVIADARDLHARLAAREGTDVCALLADAETRLVRDALDQTDLRHWWVHAGNVVLNAGVGLFLIFGFHHWTAGILNAVGGAAVGEAIILTQPTGAIDSLRRYREGVLDDGAAPTSVSFARTF
jgi:hypothetical protein